MIIKQIRLELHIDDEKLKKEHEEYYNVLIKKKNEDYELLIKEILETNLIDEDEYVYIKNLAITEQKLLLLFNGTKKITKFFKK